MNFISDNPFPGLRAFGQKEQHLFFGREDHIKDLLSKLGNNHFVAIVGTSGSGKSSLVRAGLLPRLLEGALTSRNSSWLVATMRPGNTPLKNLADALATPAVFGSTDPDKISTSILEILREDQLGLIQAVRHYIPDGKQVLILLDQFEEIFRFGEEIKGREGHEAVHFINLITQAIRQRDVPIYVVLTIRSDFLGDCAQFEGLPEAINDGHYLVPRLNRDQNKRAITGPVEYAKGKIAPRLIQKVLEDLGDNPDQLPILQHALMRSWDTWKAIANEGVPMDLRHYEMTGGMSLALSAHADEAFAELESEAQQKLAVQVLKCLTMKAADNRGVRRPSSIKTLCDITQATRDEVISVLRPFRKKGRTFILPDEDTLVKDETVMDISHESLMRAWNRLNVWVNEEAESAALYQRLCTGAQLYKEGKAALWRDPELQVALDWKEKNNPNAAWAAQYNTHYQSAIEFLEKSRNERTLERKRIRRRRFITNASVTTFLVVVSVLSFWAMIQTRKAQDKSAEALAQRDEAEQSRTAAAESEKKANESASLAQMNAMEADSARKEAERQRLIALQNASNATQNLLIAEERKKQEEEQRIIADNQNKIAQAEREKATLLAEQLSKSRMLELAQSLSSKVQNRFVDFQLPGLLALQANLFHTRNGGNQYDPVIYSGLYAANLQVNKQYSNAILQGKSEMIALSYSPSDAKLSVVSLNGIITIFSIDGRTAVVAKKITLPGNKIYSTAVFSSDLRKLVTGSDENEIRLWDLTGATPTSVSLNGPNQILSTAVFSNDNKLLAIATRNNKLLLWDLSKATAVLAQKADVKSPCRSLCFNPDGSKLVAGTEEGEIIQFETGRFSSETIFTHTTKCSAMAFNPVNAEQIACGFKDGKAWLINIRTEKMRELKASNAAVDAMCFNKSGSLIAISSADEVIRLFPVDNSESKPILVSDHHAKSKHLVFGPGEKLFATCEFTLRFWETSMTTLSQQLSGQIKRNLSKKEWLSYIGTDIPYEKTIPQLPARE